MVVLSLLFLCITLEISLMMPLLSVLVARYPTDTLSVIYERYSAAS